ncbi:MAG: hypothetical protein CMJ28_07885 [Phycisphaerae bacterium]|nr:hypothetical protein [Phycisphaerae bacterium]
MLHLENEDLVHADIPTGRHDHSSERVIGQRFKLFLALQSRHRGFFLDQTPQKAFATAPRRATPTATPTR